MSKSAYSLGKTKLWSVWIIGEKLIEFDTYLAYKLWKELRLEAYLQKGYKQDWILADLVLFKPYYPLDYC